MDNYISVLDEILEIVNTTRGGVSKAKEMALKSWMAIHCLQIYAHATMPSLKRHESLLATVMHPAIKAAFEAAYPPQKDIRTTRTSSPLAFPSSSTMELGKKRSSSSLSRSIRRSQS